MGIVLQFQSLPGARQRPEEPLFPNKSNGKEQMGKIIIFPGIRIDREKEVLNGINAGRCKTGEAPAE